MNPVTANQQEIIRSQMAEIADLLNSKRYADVEKRCFIFLDKYDRGTDAGKVADLLVKLCPKNADAFNMRGIVCFNNNLPADAAKSYAEAMRLNPRHGPSMINYGNLLHSLGKLNEAEEFFRMSLELLEGKQCAAAYSAMANIYLDKADPQSALDYALKASEINKNDSSIFSILATVYVVLGYDDEAEKYLKKALSIDPYRIKSLINLAKIYERRGNCNLSEKYFREACSVCKTMYGNDYSDWPQDDEKLKELFYRPLLASGHTERSNHRILNNRNLDDEINNNEIIYLRIDSHRAVLRLPDMHLIGNGGYLIDENKSEIYMNGVFVAHGLERRAVVTSSDKKTYVIIPDFIKIFDKPVIYMGGANNYYHWVCDYLPRLSMLEHIPELRDIPVVINGDIAGFQKESLELSGFDLSSLHSAGKDEYVHFADYVYFLHISGRPLLQNNTVNWMKPALTKHETEWLRKTYALWMKPKPENPKRLFLSRKDAKFRLCLNEDEIFGIAKEYGFEKVQNENMSFADQIALYSGVEAVMGVHGAGFTNMVFAPENATLIELHSKSELPPFYKNMTSLIGQKHYAVDGIVTEALHPLTPPFWNFTVDKEKVRAILEDVFGKIK